MDIAEQLRTDITNMKVELGMHKERLDDLEEYKKRQNGALQRVEEKVERMHLMVIGLLGSVVASLALLIANLMKGG